MCFDLSTLSLANQPKFLDLAICFNKLLVSFHATDAARKL